MPGTNSGSETVVGNPLAGNGAEALVAPPVRPMQQDLRPHVEAWENFMALTKWSTIAIIVILALLALFLL